MIIIKNLYLTSLKEEEEEKKVKRKLFEKVFQ
jgi:hypothetical protein